MEQTLLKLWEKLELTFERIVLLIPNLIFSLLVAVAGFFLVRLIERRMTRFLSRKLENHSISVILSKVTALILTVGLLFIILGILHLDTILTSLLATAGVFGLAVGLALQEPISNAFSGIMLSVKKRLRIDDIIETNGTFGTVKEINLRSTVIHTPEGHVVTIPNKMVVQNPIINYSFAGRRRVELDGNVSYGENLDKVEKAVYEAMKKVNYQHKDGIEFFFTAFGDSAIQFRVRFWIKEASQSAYLTARSDALRNIRSMFQEMNIVIPFPIRTLDFGINGGRSLREELDKEGSPGMNRTLTEP